VGFNKRYINFKETLLALETIGLKNYYGKSDALIFEDSISSTIYDYYSEGQTETQILNQIKKNTEEKTNEVH
jgi:hypothetical protein